MRTTFSIVVTAAELKSVAQYQDNFADSIAVIAKAFGQEIPKAPSTFKKLQIALGATDVKKGKTDVNGIRVDWESRISKNGVEFSFEMESHPKVVTEMMSMYSDIISMYLPLVTSTAAGFTAVSALVERRVEQANSTVAKLN